MRSVPTLFKSTVRARSSTGPSHAAAACLPGNSSTATSATLPIGERVQRIVSSTEGGSCREFNGVVSVSESSLRALRAVYELDVPTTVLPRAVEPDELRPKRPRAHVRAELSTPAQAPVTLYLGSLQQEKRLDRWLRAADMTRNMVPDAVFWIVGDGPLRPLLEQLAADLDLTERTRFIDARSDVAEVLGAADLLLLSSDSEGTPGVVLEAQAAGRAVVATDVGGTRACLVPGRTGYLVPREDEVRLGAAVGELLRDSDKRETMGREGQAFINENFHMKHSAEQYRQFYSRVADARLRRIETAVCG